VDVGAAGGGRGVAARLRDELPAWRRAGTPSVWLRVPLAAGAVLPDVARLGFRFHHAHGDAAMLVLWLGVGPSKIPPFATHQVGVAGLVLDRAGHVLVVREAHRDSALKLPGGLAEAGEDFGQTAVREVFEETGVRAEFREMLALRHQHGADFGRSDLYVVCHLEPTTTALRPDWAEVREARWMPLDSYIAETASPFNRLVAERARARLLRRDAPGLAELDMASGVHPGRRFKLYYPQPCAS
jgi:ADP-ribose pyrophosphatase YjhB (NUDIX family)